MTAVAQPLFNPPTLSKRASGRKERCKTWAEFEPLLSQLRQATGKTNQDDALRAVGYAGATMLSDWRTKNEVPTVAFHAITGFLADLRIERERGPAPVIRQFELDELGELFQLVLTAADGERKKRFLPKISKLIADAAR